MNRDLLLIVTCAALATAANSAFRYVLPGRLSWRDSIQCFMVDSFALLLQPIFLAGLILLAASIGLWMLVMAKCDLSFAYPAQIGLVITFTTLTSCLLFADKLSPANIVGLLLILLGVGLVRK